MNEKKPYQICLRCVMDTSDPDIIFDENGFCNHCSTAIARLDSVYFIDPIEKKEKLDSLVVKIKKSGKGKKYDCVIGLSGGVDSSYLALVAVRDLGLRPLAVHLDNGWNSELAIQNVDNIVNKLGIDLITYVLNWEEFRQIQLAFFRSSVVDLELTSDYAIFVTVNSVAKKYGINYFLIGSNITSESIMPRSWFYSEKLDFLNIKDIVSKFSDVRFKTFPKINFLRFLLMGKSTIKNIALLNYIPFERQAAIEKISELLEWKDYGGKHHESKITEFYQKYILPRKYNIDKRRAHLSSLICSKQISRDKAILELNSPTFRNSSINEDITYFCKKIGISIEEFEQIMNKTISYHYDFRSYSKYKKLVLKIMRRKL